MASAQRIVYIDLLKFYAMFLVVLGHSSGLIENKSISMAIDWNFIMTFHMPLFAILSGFFFSSRDSFKDFTIKKTRQLLVPLAFWCAVIWIIPRLIHDGYNHIVFEEPVYFKAIIRNYIYGMIDWNYWFLRALFFCFILLWLAMFLFRNKTSLSILISCSFLYIVSFCGIIPNKMPLFQGFIFLYPFFCFGFLLKKYDIWIKEHLVSLLLLSFISYCMLMVHWKGEASTFYGMNTSVFEYDSSFGVTGINVIIETFYRLLIGLSGSAFWIMLFRLLFENVSYNKFVVVLSDIGKSTLAIYILQAFFFDNIDTFLFGINKYLTFLLDFAISVAIVLGCYYIQKLTVYLPPKMQILFWGKAISR